MPIFNKSAANQNPREPQDIFDTGPIFESIWSEDDDSIDMEFGKKMDNFGQRIYEIYLE